MKPKFTQYPHMENLDEMPEVLNLPEVIVTEKVHGSGMRIAVIDGELHIGGRKLEFEDIRPDTREGLCFIQWVLDTGLDKRMIEVFPGQDVILYGEWHGSGTPKKNWPQVQKGIRYIKGNDFRVFDVKVDGKYVPQDEVVGWAARVGLKTMPVLYRGKPGNEIFHSLIDTMSRVGAENGIVDPENTIEGIVIRPPEFLWDERGRPVMAKLKIGKWAERASEQRCPRMQPKPRAVIPGAVEFAREFVTEARLGHVLDQLREEGLPCRPQGGQGKPVDRTSMADVMRLMGQDVKREGAAALERSNLEWKDVSPHVTRLAKEMFLSFLNRP